MYTSETKSLLAKAESLAYEFGQSALYQEYKACKAVIEKDPELYARVKDFKSAQTAFEFKRLQAAGTGPETHLGETSLDGAGFGEEQHVANLYTELTLNSDAAKFLACERALLAVYRETFDLLCEACEIEVGHSP